MQTYIESYPFYTLIPSSNEPDSFRLLPSEFPNFFLFRNCRWHTFFYSRFTEDLMATLSIWDTTHHKVIHGMVWQVEPDRFKLDDPQSVIGKFQRNDLTEDLWLDRPNWNQDYYVLILSSPHRTIPVVPDKPKKVENFHQVPIWSIEPKIHCS